MFNGMPWWGWLIFWSGVAIVIGWIISAVIWISFARKQNRRMDDMHDDFFSKRF